MLVVAAEAKRLCPRVLTVRQGQGQEQESALVRDAQQPALQAQPSHNQGKEEAGEGQELTRSPHLQPSQYASEKR